MDLEHLRRNYQLTRLDRKDLIQNPVEQLNAWFKDALNASVIEPNAMALSTASSEGKPSCRMVLMKKFDESGLVFFTNLKSRKARELKERPFAAGVFFWKELERQVIIEGKVEETSREEAVLYFSKRPRGSQLSAWASVQDQIISSRQILENAYEAAEKRYNGIEVPLPEFWGGFRIRPSRFEFWQGGQDRLHDRFQYLLISSEWKIDQLSP